MYCSMSVCVASSKYPALSCSLAARVGVMKVAYATHRVPAQLDGSDAMAIQ